MWWLIAYEIGGIISIPITVGIILADLQQFNPQLNRRDYRVDLGTAVGISVPLCLLGWPIWIFIVFCISGFAEHGWMLRRRS